MSGNVKRPAFLARLGAAAGYVFGGNVPNEWFPPLAPPAPLAPETTAGRIWDFPAGYNLNTTPRADEAIGFPQLRALADNYDLLRLVIETRKDQLAAQRWVIQPRDKSQSAAGDPRITAITDFLAYPDREHAWDQWLRMLVEDLLVLDAPALYLRRTRGGALYALEPVDGATIKRVIDQWGRTPLPPEPAYQQVLKGVPAVNYTSAELLYFPRNLRTQRAYGYGPVEQIVMTVNIALRRQLHQLEFYTAGTVPDALAGVPATWTAQQIGEFQSYWDALLTDNTADRRRVRFVPGDIAHGFHETKQAALKDDYDEWLARIVCYAMSVSNQWAVKQMNRATAETAADQATQEGLAPLKAWVKSVGDRLLAQLWQAPDLEMAWHEEQAIDPENQATVANTYLRAGVLTINEVRADLGREPIDGGDEPLLYTAAAVTPLRVALAGAASDAGSDAPPGSVAADPAATAAETATADHGHMSKAAGDETFGRERELAEVWRHFFASEAPRIARAVSTAAGLMMAKAAGESGDADGAAPPAAADGGAQAAEAGAATGAAAEQATAPAAASLGPLAPDAAAEAAASDAAAAQIGTAAEAAIDAAVSDAAWQQAQTATAGILQAAAQDGAAQGVGALGDVVAGISTQDITKLANPRAVAWADARAAELVRGVDDVTRAGLRSLVAQAQNEGWSAQRLADAIERGYAFSDQRAFLIARTELARSSIQGNILGWQGAAQRTGRVIRKRTILGTNENHCVVCVAARAEGAIPLAEPFAVGFAPPFHPNCYCGLVPVVGETVTKGAPGAETRGSPRP